MSDRSYDPLKVAAARLAEAGVERPAFEAQLLLAIAAGTTRLEVLRGRPVTGDELRRFEALVAQRARRIPLAYLRGTQEFYGLEFVVSSAVLIPRPDTEMLVDFVLEKLAERGPAALIDVGTGSGCIAVTAARRLPAAKVIAIDVSCDALAVARENARRHGVDERVHLVHGDALSALANGVAEMIVSNPPYIPAGDIESLQPEVRDFEPVVALAAGSDGLTVHRKLVGEAPRVLKPGGWLAVEIALGQAAAVELLLIASGFESVQCRPDLAGVPRMVIGRKPVSVTAGKE